MNDAQPIASGARLTLDPRQWYGWQAIGSQGPPAPWRASPLLVISLYPLKTGHSYLDLDALLLVAPLRSTTVHARLKVIDRSDAAIIAEWAQAGERPFEVAIEPMSDDWLHQHCAWLIERPGVGGWTEELDARTFLSTRIGSDPEQIMAAAAAGTPTWAGEPLRPRRVGEVPVELCYAGLDAFCILRGFVPQAMEEKWFVVAQPTSPTTGNILSRRSWTGLAVYDARYVMEGERLWFTSLRVALDRKVYGYGTPDQEIAAFSAVLGMLTPGEKPDWPVDDSHPRRAAAAWRKMARYSYDLAGKLVPLG